MRWFVWPRRWDELDLRPFGSLVARVCYSRMAHNPRLLALAEAVADGETPDWSSAQRAAVDATERRAVDSLRTVQTIHTLFTVGGSRRPVSPRPLMQSGEKWAALEIREHVGCGRFGDVYRAWDPALEREVALKLVAHGEAGERDSRVVSEARLMARVRHPNVLTIHGACRIDDVTGLWMELIDGRTLEQELGACGPFPEAELVRIGIDLAGALAAVHAAGLVHRDVKAQNVMREASGRIVLGDFGTGQELDEPEEARVGLVGTPAYLAPEIFDRQSATARSDIYSLGTLLFHLATGGYPVASPSLRAVRDAHALGKRTALFTLRADLSAVFVAVIERALDSDPARRFADALEMAAALRAIARRRDQRRHRGLVAIGAAIVISVVGLLSYSVSQRSTPAPSPWIGDVVETTSPRALELYQQARQVAGEGISGVQRPKLIEQLVRDALQEDPGFVMAHVMLAHALYAQPGREADGMAQMEHAAQMAAARSELERHIAEGERLGMQGMFAYGAERRRLVELSVAAFRAAVRLQPDHEWALTGVANNSSMLGRHDDAINAAESLVALRPQRLTGLWRAARAALAARKVDLASQYAGRAIATGEVIDERNAYQAGWVRSLVVHAAWIRSDMTGGAAALDESLALAQRLPATAHSSFAKPLIGAALVVGRLEQARRLAEMVADSARGLMLTEAFNPTYGRELQRAERERLADVIRRQFPDDAAATRVLPAIIDAGLIVDARRVAAVLAPSPATSPPYVNLARAELLNVEGRHHEVIALLEAPDRAPAIGVQNWVRNRLLLADALAATGRVGPAIDVLRIASEREVYMLDAAHAWAVVRSRLADLHRELGHHETAATIDDELRSLLASADRDHPLVRKLNHR